MRVVHVASSISGGAGIATMRIHCALRSAGIDSRVLCLRHPAEPDRQDVEVFPTRFARFWERGALRLGFRFSATDKADAIRERLGINGVSFSTPDSDYDIALHPLVRSADVVHLHWVGGFLDWESFFTRVNRPVAWTLHDMNPILGGFHCQADLREASQQATLQDSRLIERKASILSRFEKLHIAAPSRWIAAQARSSAVFERFPQTVIPHPINASVWRPFDKVFSRQVLGLPVSGPVLLTVAEQAGLKRKGAAILHAALRDARIAGKYHWVAIGDPRGLPQQAHSIGFIADQRLLALAYSAADLFVLPSLEESFGNVLVESLVTGTPVVGLPVGGIVDIIKDGVNGTLATDTTSCALAAAIARAGELRVDRELVRHDTASSFNPSRIAAEYVSVYDSLRS